MELCKSVGRSGKCGFREIVGMRVLDDMGLCSDRCKLYEVVGPYGKCEDRVYRGCEKKSIRKRNLLMLFCECDKIT